VESPSDHGLIHDFRRGEISDASMDGADHQSNCARDGDRLITVNRRSQSPGIAIIGGEGPIVHETCGEAGYFAGAKTRRASTKIGYHANSSSEESE
jgi:hypothetical protein